MIFKIHGGNNIHGENNGTVETTLLSDFDKQWVQYCENYKKLPSRLGPQRRIIVIGDIHGDFDVLVNLLSRASVINKNNPNIWTGGDTKVVQVGDQIDSRNRFNNNYTENYSDIKILHYLTKLHNEAEKVGGAIYSLLGNHELMNVLGDFRYVSDNGFLDLDTETKFTNKEAGKAERARMFKPGNKLSKFLACTRQVAIIIGNNLFVHGGIMPFVSENYKITDINRLMTLYLWNVLNDKDINDYKKIFDNMDMSPLWTRAFGDLKKYPQKCDELMAPLFKMYSVGKIFVGHTIVSDEKKIETSCNDRVYHVDIGASKAMKNKNELEGVRTVIPGAQIVEILDDKNYNLL
jgi:hypothetical protein